MFDEFKIKFNEPVWHKEDYEIWGQQYPLDFFNRKVQANELLAVLQRLDVRQPVIIVGERRSGKTSMLRYVVEHLKNKFIPVTVPAQGILTAQEFFSELLGELQGIQDHSWPGLKGEPTQAFLIQTLRNYYKTKKNKAFVQPLLIWIDELDAIIEHNLASEEEKEKIMGLLQRLVEHVDIPCKVLFSITHEIPDSPHVRTSPLFTKGRIVKMTPFPEDDALQMVQNMVQEGVTWAEVEKHLEWDKFCQLSGCWPYYMKALLLHLSRTDPGVEEGWLEHALEKAMQDENIRSTLYHLYQKHFADEHKAVLLWMVRSDGKLSEASLAATESLLPAADALVKRFYLQKKDGSYTFRVGFLQYWLAHNWHEFITDWRNFKNLTALKHSYV